MKDSNKSKKIYFDNKNLLVVPGKWGRVVCFVAAGRAAHVADVEGSYLRPGPPGVPL